MPTVNRVFERATFRAGRDLREIGSEFRERRLELGLSQLYVATACRTSRPRYTRIEAGRVLTLSVPEIHRIAGVLGLDAAIRLYPGGLPLRDGGQVRRLHRLLELASPPLSHRTEVPVRAEGGGGLKAWDAMLFGHDKRTAIELEMRLHDIQAGERRLALKRRDDPVDHVLLVIADTKHNRRVLAEIPAFADLPRLPRRDVVAALRGGEHPGTGMILF